MFKETTNYISASILIEYWYCPRFIYFMKVLDIRQYEEKRLKVNLGREVHKKKYLQPEYLRKTFGVIKKENEVYLSDKNLEICGIIDEILFLENNEVTLLDYKYAYNKHKFDTQFLQSVFYAILIEKNYNTSIHYCYIVYTREGTKPEKYEISEKNRNKVLESIKEVHDIIRKGLFPKGTKYKRRCDDCTYRNICVK